MDEMQKQALVFQRCFPGSVCLRTDHQLLVDVSGRKPVFFAQPPYEKIIVPQSGEWFLVSDCLVKAGLGLADLIPYRVSSMPGKTFYLGFYSSFRMRAVHMQGLQRWMKGRQSATGTELLQQMTESVRQCVLEALYEILGNKEKDYAQILAQREKLEKAIAGKLFRFLFYQGLCMQNGSYQIERIAKPMIRIDE